MQTRALLGIFLLYSGLATASFSRSSNGETGYSNADTISAKEVLKSRNLAVIPKLSDEQLVVLIDLLFELDSIPVDMVGEISKTVRKRKAESGSGNTVKEIVKPVTLSYYESSTPASQYYSVFDSKHLTPIEDLWNKSDTGYVIDLFPEGHEKFYMPTCAIVSSPFGWRDSSMHNGIDLDLNKGDPVVSAWDGVVRVAGKHGNYGNVVVIRHYNGLETTYAHFWKIKVKVGQQVKAGQTVGLGGSSGRSTGSHLHFETRFKGIPINPKYFISFKTETPIGKIMVIRKTRNGMCAYPKDAILYTVEKGDNIWEIAKRFGTSIPKLKELNGVSGKSYRIKPGMKVRVS